MKTVAEQVVERYREIGSIRRAGTLFGLSQERTRALLVSMGEPIRLSTCQKAMLADEHGDEIVARYRDGMGAKRAGEPFGLSGQAVLKLLKRRNEPLHRSWRRNNEPKCCLCEVLLSEYPGGKDGLCGLCTDEGWTKDNYEERIRQGHRLGG